MCNHIIYENNDIITVHYSLSAWQPLTSSIFQYTITGFAPSKTKAISQLIYILCTVSTTKRKTFLLRLRSRDITRLENKRGFHIVPRAIVRRITRRFSRSNYSLRNASKLIIVCWNELSPSCAL